MDHKTRDALGINIIMNVLVNVHPSLVRTLWKYHPACLFTVVYQNANVNTGMSSKHPRIPKKVAFAEKRV
ncbi:unnamed protein product [Bursaphelenchus okinawaensis]|uniref:Uncharacterized protein n=1 Tax=Bursaphelenchus okinawaensis TaxID=465554 RepID=A0A811KED1_9BILA|nr:unnamed protein product [Bursaphelenchus okinawaensis]CAG9102259.1 unnamed protein product [Bursaphelenchus okinawaensis]